MYCHTFPNQKRYIGITKQDVNKRWQKGEGYKNSFVYLAIKKYGWENIKHEILFENLSNAEAKEKEIELIAFYKTNNKKYGYNVSKGGYIPIMSEETKEKLRKANIGKKQSKDTIEKRVSQLRGRKRPDIAEIMKLRKGKLNPWFGKPSHVNQKNAASMYCKFNNLGGNNPNSKAVLQFDTEGKFINKFDSMVEAANTLNLKSHSAISKCCKGKLKTAYGYVWKYEQKELT